MMSSTTTVSMEIGGKSYSIDTEKMPYFKSYLSFRTSAGQDTEEKLEHGEIPHFSVAHYSVEHGFRQCFRKLGTDLEDYHALCDTFDFLGVDVLQGNSVDSIRKDMRLGKAQYELEYKSYRTVKGDKSLARDSAFQLLYLILKREFEDEVKDSQKVYNTVFFVASHPAIFKYRAKKMVRAAYEERFKPTEKQIAKLDQWPAQDLGADGASDRTTDDSSSSGYSFNSDCYD